MTTEVPMPEPPAPEPEPDDDDEEEEAVAAFEGTLTSDEPLVAPDGHVNLSQEDIDARDAAAE